MQSQSASRWEAGPANECAAEAFDTMFNVLILVYPLKALQSLLRRHTAHTDRRRDNHETLGPLLC
ncbi:MAG: hypothetical protein EOQ98_06640 [Mesorhizobium sp.]|nr:MAG: hypothetical protein EOQ98_06640 [Mesorhizobium sp.]TIM51526.1 MAG: hypothetical protein E5Y69_05020 [Mesorhizobium sp.]